MRLLSLKPRYGTSSALLINIFFAVKDQNFLFSVLAQNNILTILNNYTIFSLRSGNAASGPKKIIRLM